MAASDMSLELAQKLTAAAFNFAGLERGGHNSLQRKLKQIESLHRSHRNISVNGDTVYFWSERFDDDRGLRSSINLQELLAYGQTFKQHLRFDFDLNELATDQNANWSWSHSLASPSGLREILFLMNGGSRRCYCIEFDTVERKIVTPESGGFFLPVEDVKMGNNDVDWLDDDTLLVCSPFGEIQNTAYGYARTTRIWKRHQPITEAHEIFAIRPESRKVEAQFICSGGRNIILCYEYFGAKSRRTFILDEDGKTLSGDIDFHSEDVFQVAHGQVVVQVVADCHFAGKSFTRADVLSFHLSDLIKGRVLATKLWSPSTNQVLLNIDVIQDGFLLSSFEGERLVFRVLSHEVSRELLSMPQSGDVTVTPLLGTHARMRGVSMLVTVEHPTSRKVYFLDKNDQLSLIINDEYIEKDRTVHRIQRIPTIGGWNCVLCLYGLPDLIDGARDPQRKLAVRGRLSNGYKRLPGFELSGCLWLMQGGVLAHIYLIGSGMLGPDGRKAGMGAEKPNVARHLEVATQYLHDVGISAPERTAFWLNAANSIALEKIARIPSPDVFSVAVSGDTVYNLEQSEKLRPLHEEFGRPRPSLSDRENPQVQEWLTERRQTDPAYWLDRLSKPILYIGHRNNDNTPWSAVGQCFARAKSSTEDSDRTQFALLEGGMNQRGQTSGQSVEEALLRYLYTEKVIEETSGRKHESKI